MKVIGNEGDEKLGDRRVELGPNDKLWVQSPNRGSGTYVTLASMRVVRNEHGAIVGLFYKSNYDDVEIRCIEDSAHYDRAMSVAKLAKC
jgi:hypothetical protein